MKDLLLLYLVTINAAGFVLMLADKHKAKKKLWRIPEATLMTVAALGGSVGSLLGMYTVRHKTKHPKFTIGIPLLLAGRIDATLNAEVVFADYHTELQLKSLKKILIARRAWSSYETCFMISFLINHKTGSAVRRCLPD